eukprot:1920677-Amphidinium_carterae.1
MEAVSVSPWEELEAQEHVEKPSKRSTSMSGKYTATQSSSHSSGVQSSASAAREVPAVRGVYPMPLVTALFGELP